ncbi:MAG TPA: hypothetical protein VHM01_14455 [Alphaproteobacteria bacterium]|nr:hypothetical protein [Alphaproteobacteria bacterium]
MRGDQRISLRLFLLLLFSGGLMGWMVLVITAYYFVRVDENQWVQRNIEAISNISPAAGGKEMPKEPAAPAK